MNNTDTGFVISVSPYREHDAMVHFLGETYGLLRFVLPGYYKSTSKQSALGLEFSKVRLRFNYRENNLNRIQNGELLDAYLKNRNNYDWLLYMQLISELALKFYEPHQKKSWYELFDSSLCHFDLNELLIAIVEIIKQSGLTPEINECVVSGSKQIADFSISRGGFVALEYKNPLNNLSIDELRFIRYLFNTETLNSDLFNGINILKIIDLLIRYLEYHMSVKFNSWKLIYDV